MRGWLFRGDLSVAPGFYYHYVGDTSDGMSESYASALGPRVALNVGYAPNSLVRLGFGAATDFALNAGVEEQGIPNTELDGWMRWTAGPTVGFRFGPRVPIELEAGLAFAHMMFVGSQANSGFFSLGDQQVGNVATAQVIYRPAGPAAIWGVHAGLSGGWGYSQRNRGAGFANSVTGVTTAVLLGVSIGL